MTLFTLSIRGALRSLHWTCLSLLPLSTSFIMLAQSGRFLGLDFSASSFCICESLSGGSSLRITLLGGGGGGRGGGGGGTFARDELFDKVGAPVVLSLFESGTLSPRDRDLSMRICRSSCGLEFGSCRPFSRNFVGTGRPLGIFSLFGCFGIIVILLCLRDCPSVGGAVGSAGFGTLFKVTWVKAGTSSVLGLESRRELRVQGADGIGNGLGPSLTHGGRKVVLCGG